MAKKKSAKKTATKTAGPKPSAAQSATPMDAGLIEPGKRAPAIALRDREGTLHRLADFKGGWVVLYFYPKDDTSGCTAQACQFRDQHDEFSRLEATVIGISPDDEKSHERFARKHDLNFLLLADPEKKVLENYGVWQEKSMYGRKYMGVVRTTYLIDPAGEVAHRWDKVKVPDHAADVRAKLVELRGN